MHVGNSQRHENPKDSEATLGIYDILDKGRGGGGMGGRSLKWEWAIYR